jgi:hypothetical protein
MIPMRHVLSQGPVLRTLGWAALRSLRKKTGQAPATSGPGPGPGPWIEAELPPRPEGLVRDYVRHVGGDPAWYRGRVPAHLFPQWAFPLVSRALAGTPYPLVRVLNAGCRIVERTPLEANEPLHVRARIESIDDDGRRAIITTRILTGTARAPEALACELRAFVPLQKSDGQKGHQEKKPRPQVPLDVRELAFVRVGADAGLDFAKLTGDFNPIHWLPPYARAAGFRGCILHGFSTLARAVEAIDRALLAGDPTRLSSIDVRFVRPLPLPARIGVYVAGDALWVGDAPGGGAYLEGRFTLKENAHG